MIECRLPTNHLSETPQSESFVHWVQPLLIGSSGYSYGAGGSSLQSCRLGFWDIN